MKTILIVKTSSLGDVVHNLPVASDIRRHFPDAGIDWVVEEPYAPLVGLHSAVRRVIPVALRRWRRRPLGDRKSTRLNSSHLVISYAVFCLKKKKKDEN